MSGEQVWVLDDPRVGTAVQAIAIAERLGVPFRRIPLSWNWMAHVAGLAPRGSLLGLSSVGRGTGEGVPAGMPMDVFGQEKGPVLTLSSGSRSAAVALWVKQRFGSFAVHCMRPGFQAGAFDLLVLPRHDRRPLGARVVEVLGAPNRVTSLGLRRAKFAWSERLGHLPQPRVALLVGGAARGDLSPALAHDLGRRVARLAASLSGSVLATTSRRTGHEATEALASGLGSAMHVLFRWGEPGDNPYLGFLALADAIVVTADSVSMISEACATSAPVFIAAPQLAGPGQRRLMASLFEDDQARPLGRDLSPWDRTPLDEASLVAGQIRRLCPLE
jgi:hypothetical protein